MSNSAVVNFVPEQPPCKAVLAAAPKRPRASSTNHAREGPEGHHVSVKPCFGTVGTWGRGGRVNGAKQGFSNRHLCSLFNGVCVLCVHGGVEWHREKPTSQVFRCL